MITPANALKWSMWLAATHPLAFKAVLDRVRPPLRGASQRPGLGNAPRTGIYIPGSRNRPWRGGSSFARGRFGTLGDDLPEVTITADGPDLTPPDMTPMIVSDPVLQDINTNMDVTATSFDLGSAAAATDTSGGFWSSLGSGLSSVGSGLASAVGAVAGAVLNPQTLASAGNLAATVIKANGANAQQQAVLQAQMLRTANGTGAATIRYATNPATGQPLPMVYNPATGQYQPAPGPAGGSLAGGSLAGLSQYLPAILIGGGLLLVGSLFMSMRK